MALVVPNVGEIVLLDNMIKGSSEDFVLKLYSNDKTPAVTDVASDYTEATFTGYSAKALTAGDFTSATTNGEGKAETTHAVQSWTCGATGGTVYGYYVVGATSGTLLWAQRFGITRTLATNDVLNVTPRFTLSTE